MKRSDSKATPPSQVREFPSDPPVRLIGLLLTLITVLVYLPVGSHDFIYFDDPNYVSENGMVQNGLTWAGFKWAFVGWHASNWHPLTWLSHQLDCQLFGLNAGAHHLVNVLFHAANTVLLFQLWRRLTNTCWPAAGVAALFAWHPLHVESVAWVAERKDVLCTFFGLLALLAYGRYAAETRSQNSKTKIQNPKPGGRQRWSRFYWASLAAFALALLAKPMLVTLPFVLLLLDFWPLRRGTGERPFLTEWRPLILEKRPFFLLATLSCLVTVLAQRQEAVVALQNLGLGSRLVNAVLAVVGYLGKTLWPVNLCVFYPRPEYYSVVQVALAAVIVTVISLWVWRGRRWQPWLLTGWLWFLGMLVPVIGLVQVGKQAMADRYTYLPGVGLFVMAAFGLAEARGRWKIPSPVLGVGAFLILGGCVAVTEYQLSFWRDTETLFTRALAITPNNGMAQMTLGVALDRQGRSAEALSRYREALRLDSSLVEAHNNLGNLLASQGQPAAALEQYQTAVRLQPATPLVHENLGTQLAELGRFDEALAEYQTAARLDPSLPQPWYLTGKLRLRRGESQAAVTAFQTALRLAPEDVPSLTWLARVLAADENARIRDGVRAMMLAEKANTLTAGRQPFVLGTLAMACAETGRLADARQTVQTALDLAAGGSPETISNLQAQLRCYEAGQPFRETFPPAPP